MINLIDIYNRVQPYIKAHPSDINIAVSECMNSLSFKRHDNRKLTDISSLITAPVNKVNIPVDILNISSVFVNNEKLTERYDADFLSGSYYYIDNHKRTINFSFDVLTTDTVEIDVEEYYTPSITKYDNTTSFDIPEYYIAVIKAYVLMTLFSMMKYENPDKMLYYKRLYEKEYNELTRKSNAGQQYMSLGSRL